jgi:lipopolysaccharide/colanic/teichoic acid biosynthesis glycosyltransferase
MAAGLLLALVAPLLAVLIVVIRLTSRGGAIYSQQRVGRNGRTFVLYKLRTMRQDAEASTGPVWSCDGDSRVTRLGRFLRRSHLDELPQLWNVLRGEMAFVGPRPERPEIVQKLVKHVPGYLYRLALKPGITGFAQVTLPADTDYKSVSRKLAADLAYAQRASASLDARILICTALKVISLHTHATRLLLPVDLGQATGESAAACLVFEMPPSLASAAPPPSNLASPTLFRTTLPYRVELASGSEMPTPSMGG